jgi:uncharacterized membrane protein
MTEVYKPNISAIARWTSVVAGTALALEGFRRRNRFVSATGFGLLARGVSGFCPVSYAIGRNTASQDTRTALGGSRGVKVQSSVTIYRAPFEVYSYWRQLENLPRFMRHLEKVEEDANGRSRWTARGPLDTRVFWEAEIINDVPVELISWRTLPDSDVVSAGSVRFKSVGADRATRVNVKLQYAPPAGKVGATLAWLVGEDPQRQIDEDLRRFKQILETEEAPTRRSDAESAWRSREDAASHGLPILPSA